MTTLNGLTRPLESFIHKIYARKEILQIDVLWEECVQEEAIVANQKTLLRDDDHLATHTRRRKGKHHFKKETHNGSYPPRKFQKNKKGDYKQKDFSSYQYVTIVIRWDTLPKIVQQRKKKVRGRIIKDILLT